VKLGPRGQRSSLRRFTCQARFHTVLRGGSWRATHRSRTRPHIRRKSLGGGSMLRKAPGEGCRSQEEFSPSFWQPRNRRRPEGSLRRQAAGNQTNPRQGLKSAPFHLSRPKMPFQLHFISYISQVENLAEKLVGESVK